MRLTEVRVEVTIPTVQYGNEKIGLTAILESGDDVAKAIQDMKAHCYGQVVGDPVDKVKGKALVEAGKKASKAAPLRVEEEEEEEELSEAEEAAPVSKAETKSSPSKEVAKAAEKAAKEAAKAEEKEAKEVEKAKKKLVQASTPYESTDAQKKRLGEWLDTVYPGVTGWRKVDSLKAKAIAASKKLQTTKEPFLDGSGEILESFKDAMKKIIAE